MWSHFEGRARTRAESAAYLSTLHWTDWRPQGITLHNTSAPTLKQWVEAGPSHDARIRNLQSYYQNELGWHAGPHFFVSRNWINWFSNPLLPGVHSRCWNATRFGIEQVGEYNIEDYNSGDGAMVRDNALYLVALLNHRFGFDPEDFKFHIQCTQDNHDCPGIKARSKADIVRRIRAFMAEISGQPVPIIPTKPPVISDYLQGTAKWIQVALNTIDHAGLDVDGDLGPLSEAAIKKFQQTHGLTVDGIVGPKTIAVLVMSLTGSPTLPPAPPTAPPSTPVVVRNTDILMTEFAGPNEKLNDTINGYTGARIDWRKPGVALPYHFHGVLPKVRVFHGNKNVVCDIVDIGPHVASLGVDPYWEKHTRPKAETATQNKAGMDATAAVHEALGIPGAAGTRSVRVDWEFV